MHAPHCHRRLKVSDSAPKVRRAVADAGRWATLPHAKRNGTRVFLANLLLLIMCVVASAAGTEPSRRHEVVDPSSTFSLKDKETFDFQSLGPKEFLNYLETLKGPFTVYATHIGWLRPADIPLLLSQVASEKPCAAVVSIYSQVAPIRSTIGNEAVFLLLAIRDGRFPPYGVSVGALDSGKRAELLNWAMAQAKE